MQKRTSIYTALMRMLRASDSMAMASEMLMIQAETHVINGKMMACVPAEMFVEHVGTERLFLGKLGDVLVLALKRWPFIN